MKIDVMQIVLIIIQAVPWSALAIAAFKWLSHSKYSKYTFAVKTTVQAAQQLYKSGIVQDRKKYVLDALSKKYPKIPFDEIDRDVESAVMELNSWFNTANKIEPIEPEQTEANTGDTEPIQETAPEPQAIVETPTFTTEELMRMLIKGIASEVITNIAPK